MLGRDKGPDCVDASGWVKGSRKSTLYHDYWQAKEAKALLPLDRCRQAVERQRGIAHAAVCSGPDSRFGFDYLLEACVPGVTTRCGRVYRANGRRLMVTYASAEECLAAERVLPPTL